MKTYVEIDNNQLKSNVLEIINNNNYKYYIGVVKANGYGHGYGIVNSLIEAGINYLAVSNINEAKEVRKINKDIPIICLNPVLLSDICLAINLNVTLTISSKNYLDELIKILKASDKLNVHLKIDSGLNRLGVKSKKDIDDIYKTLMKYKNIFLEGIYTHLSSSLHPDEYYKEQIETFINLTKDIDLSKIPIVHIYKSNTVYYLDKLSFCTGVRLGVLMYGVLPDKYFKTNLVPHKKLNLKTAFKLISHVIETKKVFKGDYIGYNKSYQVKKDARIAVVQVGYSDGILMQNNGNYVYINNNKYTIIGGINMNVITVLVDESVNIGDKVVLIDNIYDYIKHNNIRAQVAYGSIDSSIKRKYFN